MQQVKQFEAVLIEQLMRAIRPVIHKALMGGANVKQLPAQAKKAVTVPTAPTRTIVIPREGGKCRQVWDQLDKMKEPKVADIVTYAEKHGWSGGNARTEFYKWRIYRAANPAQAAGKMSKPPAPQRAKAH